MSAFLTAVAVTVALLFIARIIGDMVARVVLRGSRWRRIQARFALVSRFQQRFEQRRFKREGDLARHRARLRTAQEEAARLNAAMTATGDPEFAVRAPWGTPADGAVHLVFMRNTKVRPDGTMAGIPIDPAWFRSQAVLVRAPTPDVARKRALEGFPPETGFAVVSVQRAPDDLARLVPSTVRRKVA
jgi:hypothetical protein